MSDDRLIMGPEYFTLRHGERFYTCGHLDPEVDTLGVCLATAPHLPVPFTEKTAPFTAILACAKNIDGEWGWCQLGISTKEAIGRTLEQHNVPRDVWLSLHILAPGEEAPSE